MSPLHPSNLHILLASSAPLKSLQSFKSICINIFTSLSSSSSKVLFSLAVFYSINSILVILPLTLLTINNVILYPGAEILTLPIVSCNIYFPFPKLFLRAPSRATEFYFPLTSTTILTHNPLRRTPLYIHRGKANSTLVMAGKKKKKGNNKKKAKKPAHANPSPTAGSSTNTMGMPRISFYPNGEVKAKNLWWLKLGTKMRLKLLKNAKDLKGNTGVIVKTPEVVVLND